MKKRVLLCIIIFAVSFFIGKNVEAANISSNIDEIDDGRYPGFKTAIKEMQAKYPNWKFNVLYTGLNWNDAVNGEYAGHGGSPTSLIPETYPDSWVCPICGHTKYDASKTWHCASKEAIAYMMDPRNSLEINYIFQFQDLSSAIGDRDAIKAMVQNTYLNQESYINAIMEAARLHSVSPFHIVSRLRQEQGANGNGIMNGYVYTIEEGDRKGQKQVVYNLFNIGVSGNGEEALLSGARRAYTEGWFTPEESIKGGTKFIREKYIDKGQTTLYFQKFNVVDKNNLYQHQYMQNIMAANSEANTMYRAYRDKNILNSPFEFTIPLYEGMPRDAEPRPVEEYRGSINTELININFIVSNSGSNYIGGYVYIAEWVGNDCRTPSGTPQLILKSTDGKVAQEMYVGYEGGIKYYFDRKIDTLDMSKEYYIEARLTSDKNIEQESKKVQRIYLPNQIIKQGYKGRTIKVINNKIVFSEGEYKGDINTELAEIKLVQNGNGETYLAGFVHIVEYINQSGNTPKSMPEIWLKSTDGKFATVMYVGYEEKCEYYFDKIIEYLDTSKTYYIEAKLTTEDNISTNKRQQVAIKNQQIGKFKAITVNAKNNNIILNYKGNINTELKTINLIRNEKGQHYISGYIYIAEYINNECKTPAGMPKILLKSTDNTFETEMYVGYESSIEYYFDKRIDDLDINKEYYIEAQLSNENNLSENKTQQVKISNRTLENGNQMKLEIRNNRIKVIDKTLYYGSINTELYQMNIIQNGQGDNYISGYIYIAEYVNNECRTPSGIPQMTLRATDGSYSTTMYVGYEGGIKYYFDKNIENIDTNKQYEIEVKLTGSKNIAPIANKTQIAKITQKGEVGTCTNGNKVSLQGNNIIVKDNKYYGSINTELYQMNIIQNGQGDNYISGYIYIAEYVNNECRTPSGIPQMTLRATDGSYSTTMYVGYEGGIKYYFDKNIENIDTNKQYEIEVKLTGSKNIAPIANKTQIAKITQKGEVGTCTNGNKVSLQGNNILIEKIKTTKMLLKIREEDETKPIQQEDIKEIENIEKETNTLSNQQNKEEKTEKTEILEEKTEEEIQKTKDLEENLAQ